MGLLIAIPIFLVTLISVFFVFWLNTDNEPETEDTIVPKEPISEVQQLEIETIVESFINGVGSFGFKTENINSSNILDVNYIVSTDPLNSGSFFVPRAEAYRSVRDFVHPSGPLYYSANMTGSWSNEFDTRYTSTFEIASVDMEVAPEAGYLNIDRENMLATNVEVVFSSVETVRSKTADDSTWDGTFDVSRKTYNDSMRVTVVFDNGWKIYSISDLDNAFLLASWRSPNVSAYAEAHSGFEKFDTIKADVVDRVPEIEVGDSDE